MKLVYIANARLPSEKAHTYQIMKMCEAFARNGVEVKLFLPFRFQTTEKLRKLGDFWRYYGISKKFTIIKLPSFDLIWIDAFTLKLSVWRFLLQAFSFAFSATLYSLFKKADVYYTREWPFAFLFGSLKSIHGRRIFYESHQYEPAVLSLMKKGKIDGVVVITNRLKELYLEAGIPEPKILVAPDGVDLDMFSYYYSIELARRELGIPLDKKIITYTGHLFDWKGTHVLAMAMKHLPDDYITYFVGGTEADIAKFKIFIQQNKVSSIVVKGHVPPVEIPKYLAASDVLVLPNINVGLSEFTSPLKLFEYMASKKPIVASALPAIKEVLNEGNSVLVESGSPEALAQGIRKILSDAHLGEKLAEKAYTDVQQYTWNIRAEKVSKFIGR